MNKSSSRLVLASGSPRRLALLRQIAIIPDYLEPAGIDETPVRAERPDLLAMRLARTKAAIVRRKLDLRQDYGEIYVLSADTVVAQGRRIIAAPTDHTAAEICLKQLSGRTHRVCTAICISAPGDIIRQKRVVTRVKFKHLSSQEIEIYLRSGEWHGKAGGYAIQGLAGAFVMRLVGSYSNVVGLPLFETVNLLNGVGYKAHRYWDDLTSLEAKHVDEPKIRPE